MIEEEVIEERPVYGRGRRVRRWRRQEPDLRRDEVVRRDPYRRDGYRDEEDYPIRRGPGLWGLIGIICVLMGLMIMASAYFGFGADPTNPYPDSGGGPGYVPDVVTTGFGGAELTGRRIMAFMGGGFLAMTGFLVTATARIAAGLVYDDRDYADRDFRARD